MDRIAQTVALAALLFCGAAGAAAWSLSERANAGAPCVADTLQGRAAFGPAGGINDAAACSFRARDEGYGESTFSRRKDEIYDGGDDSSL